MLFYQTEDFPVSNVHLAATLLKYLKITTVAVNFTASLLDHLPSREFAAFQRASNTYVEYRSWVSVDKPFVEAYKDKFTFTPTFNPHAPRISHFSPRRASSIHLR
ncbi:hypothetical protein C0992_013148, partial [Termitomyces sp. T32_za158]